MQQRPAGLPAPITCCNFERRIPDGDSVERDVCARCGHIHYVNPKIVVGSVCSWHGRILLCRRAIAPRHGFWTIPAGYLEERETPAEGAAREAMEEAMARIEINSLLSVYSVPRISQVQLIFRATLADGQFGAGPESLESELFAWEKIPWNELAFPTVFWALNHFRDAEGRDAFPPFQNPE
jgi:ADP-ribose pyrophosphatase YjhB (NUDIX family)